jgi:hypothetical protein
MFFKTVKFFVALGIGIVLLALVSVLFTDWQRAGPLAVGLAVLTGLYGSSSAAIQRRRELARRRPEVLASSQAALAAELVEASPIICYSLTRGTGELSLDEKGSLHFHADPKIPWRGWPPKRLRRLSQAERSLTIPRNQVRVAVPFDHLASGPSVVVGYDAPGHGLGWDEFILATSPRPEPAKYYPQPTGDALAWAKALDPGEGSPELQREAARYRKRLRRRMNLFFLKLTAAVETAAFVLFFGLVALGIATDGRHTVLQALAVALAAAGGIWLATVLISSLIIVAVNR